MAIAGPWDIVAAVRCTFEGIARRIEIRGAGTTSLLRADAFAEGVAERVELETARVGSLYAPVTIDRPEGLDPIDLDPAAKTYRVTYDIGPTLRIDIEAGAARSGRFQGPLAGAAACAEPDGCEVQWPDAKRIVLVVHPATTKVAALAQVGTPIRLTGKFPFLDPDPGTEVHDHLDHVTLDGAVGTLECDGARTDVSGRLEWSPGADESVRIDKGLFVTPDGLRLVVVAGFAPAGAAPSRAPWIAGAAAMAVVLVAVALVWRARRRSRAAHDAAPSALPPQPVPASSSPRAPAPKPPPKKQRQVALVMLAAPEDARFSAALARHLHAHREQLFNPHDLDHVPPGADLFAATRSAIDQARVVAVLVSAHLFAAPEPWSSLLALALTLRRERGLCLVPVIAREVDLQGTGLEGSMALPTTGAIGSPDNHAALAEVARGLHKELASVKKALPAPA